MIRKRKRCMVLLIAALIALVITLIFRTPHEYNKANDITMDLFDSDKSIDLTTNYYKSLVQSNLTRSSELSNIVLSSPWLYPKSRTMFPYIGLHNDLDALLQIMSHDSKKIMILGFDWHWQEMAQNNIYTLVRFTRTTNYIVPTGDEITLLICIELNLPCYNASSYMMRFLGNTSVAREALYRSTYYIAMVWFKIPLYLDILRKGFTIMKSDADISYTGKDLWKAYESMASKTGADLIFMREAPVNTGQFYALPNDRVMAFFEEWIASKSLFQKSPNQPALAYLKDKTYMVCNSRSSCSRVKKLSMKRNFTDQSLTNNRKIKMAAVVTYPSSFVRFGSICPPKKAMDPCDPKTLYVHPVCTVGSRDKVTKLKRLGFWLMESPCRKLELNIPFQFSEIANVSLIRCLPTSFIRPAVEKSFLNCKSSEYIPF